MTVNINIIQYLSIAGSICLILLIIELVRRHKFKEEYSILWLFSGFIFLLLSVWRDGLAALAKTIGIAYPPAALFLCLLLAVYLILIHYSTVLTKHSQQLTKLNQEIALLKQKSEVTKINDDENQATQK